MSDFRITYDGPALEASEMDVRELAPALLAIGDLLTASTGVLCGDQIQPQVNVKGSVKTGSFGIDFVLATDFLTRVKDIFASDNAVALAQKQSMRLFVLSSIAQLLDNYICPACRNSDLASPPYPLYGVTIVSGSTSPAQALPS